VKTAAVTAPQLLERLAARHADAVFVPECKLGSSWGSMTGGMRLDAWVLLKTWSPFTAIGYEIKVARSDFVRDEKWVAYRDVCHEFYFVTPRGLIEPSELPSTVGLMWSAGSSRLQVKRKAVRQEPESVTLIALMTYVLMSRVRVVGNMHEANVKDRVSWWRDWLLEREGSRYVGHMCSRRLAEQLQEAERGRRRAEDDAQRYAHIEARLVELELDPHGSGTWEVERRLGVGNQETENVKRECRPLGQRLLELAEVE
jgi:hypothetical protein